MIIVVGGIKGGTGKTTLVTNLAVMRCINGYKILLVDSDDQRSLSDWSEHRQSLGVETSWPTVSITGKTTDKQIKQMYANYDDVLVDVGGHESFSQRSALLAADVFIVPFKPRAFDMFTVGKVKDLVDEAKVYNPKLKVFAVLNQADVRGSDNNEAMELLESIEQFTSIDSVIRYRKSFGNASAKGLGVTELAVPDKKANDEMASLYKHVFCTDFARGLHEQIH